MKIFSVLSYSIRRPSRKKPVYSATRAACCMLCVTITISILRFELKNQLFDFAGRDRIERGAGLVHQQHFGLDRERARNAQPLLLTARQAGARFLVDGSFTSSQSAESFSERLHHVIQLLSVTISRSA